MYNGAAMEHDRAWDAGELGCGELIFELRLKVNELAPGSELKLTTRDAGAPQEIPAWCGLTGHTLVGAAHPDYWIRRKGVS